MLNYQHVAFEKNELFCSRYFRFVNFSTICYLFYISILHEEKALCRLLSKEQKGTVGKLNITALPWTGTNR